MGIIERSLVVKGENNSKRILALFDSGSSFTLLRSDIFKYIKGWSHKKIINQKIMLGDGRLIKIKNSAVITIKLNNNNYQFRVIESDFISEQMIIGVDFLEYFGHGLEFKNDTVVAKPHRLKNHRGVYIL